MVNFMSQTIRPDRHVRGAGNTNLWYHVPYGMRLSTDQLSFLKRAIQARVPGAEVLLFGSRVDDSKHGGDIDILVIGKTRMSVLDRIRVKVEFHRTFGIRKIDIASYSHTEPSAFRDAVSREAALL